MAIGMNEMKMIKLLFIGLFLLASEKSYGSQMTDGEKFKFYLTTAYGPGSLLFSMAGSGINQARNSEPQWGQGMEGYSKRLGSSFAQKGVERSIRFGLGALLHEDPRYFAAKRSGVVSRTLHATGESFLAHKDSGGIRPGYAHFIGIISAVYLSRRWHPEIDRKSANQVSAGGISLGLEMARNVFSEFWPDIKKKLHH